MAPDLGKRLVDTLYSVHGEHPGHRAAHAKGTCLVGLTLPVFFARDPDSFMEFLMVTRPDPETRQPDFAAVGEFLERHPETQAALGAAMSAVLPQSYLRVRYNGIHAFRLVNDGGDGTWVRYRWEPELGEENVTSDQARAGGRDYLQDELSRTLAAGPATLRLVFILAADGDSLIDPTAPWGEDREEVVAGRLEITGLADQESCEGLVFDPTSVVDGIELSDDPILHARSVAYARSFAARRGITAPTAAGSPGAPAVGAAAGALEHAGDLAAGSLRAVDVDGTRLALANVDGELHAFQDTCTHRGCSLADGRLDGRVVSCPCHGSQFDVTTGAVVRGPATEALKTFP